MSAYDPDPLSKPAEAGPPPDTRQVACCSIDMGYIKSVHGILTAFIMVLSLIATICVRSGLGYEYSYCTYSYFGAYGFYNFVSGSAFLTALLHYIIYMLTFQNKFKFVPWHIADVIWCGIFSVLYLIGNIMLAALSCGSPGLIAGVIFGFGAMVAMAAQGYDAYKRFRDQLDQAHAAANRPMYEPPPIHGDVNININIHQSQNPTGWSEPPPPYSSTTTKYNP